MLGLARVDVAVAAGAGARVAEDLERRRALAPALGDVRAARLLADGVQARAVDELLDVEVARRPRSARAPSSTRGGAAARRRAARSPSQSVGSRTACGRSTAVTGPVSGRRASRARAAPRARRRPSAGSRLELEPEHLAERRRALPASTSSTVTGPPELARHRRELGVLEPAGRDPLRERRRVEIDVERVAVRRHPARDVHADRGDLARRRGSDGGIQTPVSPSIVVASRSNAATRAR